MPEFPTQPVPAWLDPKNASVFSPAWQTPLRNVVKALGLDDPQTLILNATNPMEAPAQGVLDALGEAFPRFAKAIKAFHGSPHDFERFDLSKIGTGEGAQAYGHGLYFAEREGVAKSYSEMWDAANRGTKVRIDGKDLYKFFKENTFGTHEESRAIQRLIDDGDIDVAIRNAGGEASYPDPAAANVLREWKQRHTFDTPKGKMYEVAIKAHPDQFLDWDAPLNQQSPGVQEAVKRARDKAMGDVRPVRLHDGSYGVTRINSDGSGNVIPGIAEATPEKAVAALHAEAAHGSGQWVYDTLSRTIRKRGAFPELSIPDKAAAAQALREQGIAGIKYLDQGSRTAGEGTRNYVVFDDKLVDILKKYGWLFPTAGGAAAASQKQQ